MPAYMKKHIILLKKTFFIAGGLSILLALIDYFFNLMYFDTKGYFGAFQFLIFLIFISSLYIFFILSDIKKDKFFFLRYINYILSIVSFIFFIFWGVIYPDPLAFLFPGYCAFMTTVNLLIMSIIYLFKKTGGKYFYKEWFYFFGLIAFYALYDIIIK